MGGEGGRTVTRGAAKNTAEIESLFRRESVNEQHALRSKKSIERARLLLAGRRGEERGRGKKHHVYSEEAKRKGK